MKALLCVLLFVYCVSIKNVECFIKLYIYNICFYKNKKIQLKLVVSKIKQQSHINSLPVSSGCKNSFFAESTRKGSSGGSWRKTCKIILGNVFNFNNALKCPHLLAYYKCNKGYYKYLTSRLSAIKGFSLKDLSIVFLIILIK